MDDYLKWQNWKSERRVARDNPSKDNGLKERGFATLLILILFATLSAYGLEMYLKAHLENKMVRNEIASRQAVYAAEGGIEWVRANLKNNLDFTGGEISIGEGIVVVSVKPVAVENSYEVISNAKYGPTRRKLKVKLEKPGDIWEITEYQELYN